ncbi:hypothetical protein P3T37_005124 [Kitasatospora sp. MAA4]|uniref:hypothetical protein n=1 Tax=Kitasatospora sp. MAA4 TaxID=3035093 RepID=UPI0024736298|nr:hypothetical protein [Kitasatospora sp. MAA4]MDH6135707.1 hypothetical protein [Kitasatospora sp. MAA4]
MPKPAFVDRTMPDCQCPADCGGRPEASLRLVAVYPTVSSGVANPPSPEVHVTCQRGELVRDALSGRLGVLMDRIGTLVYLRPERGGAEWEVDQRWLQKPVGSQEPEAVS